MGRDTKKGERWIFSAACLRESVQQVAETNTHAYIQSRPAACVLWIVSRCCSALWRGMGGVGWGGAFSSSGGSWLWSLQQPNPQASRCRKDMNMPSNICSDRELTHSVKHVWVGRCKGWATWWCAIYIHTYIYVSLYFYEWNKRSKATCEMLQSLLVKQTVIKIKCKDKVSVPAWKYTAAKHVNEKLYKIKYYNVNKYHKIGRFLRILFQLFST